MKKVLKGFGFGGTPLVEAGAAERSSAAPVEEQDRMHEEQDDYDNKKGLRGDLVLVYPIERKEDLEEKFKDAATEATTFLGKMKQMVTFEKTTEDAEKSLEKLEDRLLQRAEIIEKLRHAGLTVVKHKSMDGKEMYVKVSATLERLEREAERQGIEMLVDPKVVKVEKQLDEHKVGELEAMYNKSTLGMCVKGFSDVVFGATSERVYRDFSRDERGDFDRSGQKDERLFSPLERARLIFSIVEGPRDMKGGGAELDMDLYVSDKVITSYLFLHSKGRDDLLGSWGAMSEIGPITNKKLRLQVPLTLCVVLWFLLCIFYVTYLFFVTDSKASEVSQVDLRIGLTLSILILAAGLFGMLVQPLDEVRDYLGEKVAFYFAWMEHYSRYLLLLTVGALLLVVVDASDQENDEKGTVAAIFALVYCLVVAVWTTLFGEGWKRKNAVLAHVWDVTDFEEEEDPRPEFLASYHRGRWRAGENGGVNKFFGLRGKMEKQQGFYTKDGRFLASRHPQAKDHKIFKYKYRLYTFLRSIPSLTFMFAVMVAGTFSILVFKMLTGVATIFKGSGYLATTLGPKLPLALSTVWITIMNIVYRSVAVYFNDTENYRTETEYNDALILKTVIFQFFNSYATLFYIAFIKSAELPVGGVFGLRDGRGNLYRDMCGVRPFGEDGATDYPFASLQPGCNSTNPDACDFIFVQRDCFEDLRALMISYTLLKPCYEIPMQILPLIFAKLYGQYKLLKQWAKEAAAAAADLATGGADSTRPSRRSRSLTAKSVSVELKPTESGKLPAASPPASPPPSPPADGGAEATTEGDAKDAEKRTDFHKTIALELAQSKYGGTFSEYNTKAIQYGYIAMFSSAFPLAAICAATGNFIELRIDAWKTLTTRRPRYQGAEDIGTWQHVLSFLSWMAIPVNVFILVFTSWDFRNLIVIKSLATDSGSPSFDLCYNTTDPAEISPHYLFNNPGATVGPSIHSKCQQNMLDCYANIGGVDWLPAYTYLYSDARTTQRFTDDGLCNPSQLGSSSLYNLNHCNVCKHWMFEISTIMVWTVVIIEHLLILFKLFLAYIIPDQPRWVVDANARNEFLSEVRHAKKRRASSLVDLSPAAMSKLDADIRAVKVNDDDEDIKMVRPPPQSISSLSEKSRQMSSNV